jgi:uncharacterized protein (TIGR00645 family)
MVWRLIVCTGFMVNEIIPASSARFPCLNIQSRDRSPPRDGKHLFSCSHILPAMTSRNQSRPLRALETFLEQSLFAGRWLMAPMYLGLLLSLVALLIHFIHDFLKLFNGIYDASAQDIALKVLGLLDTTLLGNLVVLMIFSGYENFVSKINSAKNAEDRPTWMGKVDYSGLKIKLIGSLVAISVIELLKDFVEAREDLNAESIKWRIAIHLTFVISGLLFAVMDYIADKRLVMDKKGEIGPH